MKDSDCFGPDFCQYNSQADAIDLCQYSDHPVNGNLPLALFAFVHRIHGSRHCATFSPLGGPLLFATADGRSLYRRHGIDVPPLRNFPALGRNVVWGDLSTITRGRNPYYLSSSPAYHDPRAGRPSAAQFCQALDWEFDGGPLLIVDTSSEGTDYLSIWQDASGKERTEMAYPPAGVIRDVQSLPLAGMPVSQEFPITFSLQSFRLCARRAGGNTFHRLRIGDWVDGGAPGPEDAQKIVDAVAAIQAQISAQQCVPVPILSHCTSGAGRSPSLVIFHAIDAAARAWEASGGTCGHDLALQGQAMVDGRCNLAHVLRNLLLNGLAARGVFGYGPCQFQAFGHYAERRSGPARGTFREAEQNSLGQAQDP
ncbi:MAG: hypothetical protein LBT98_01460 [Puniceicoccales bacterium]|jgi:hypothetical protein|nr:hypothetical protein [Puniceicoccales bacterium]